MFQSEHLVEKWKPLLEYEGLDKIEAIKVRLFSFY